MADLRFRIKRKKQKTRLMAEYLVKKCKIQNLIQHIIDHDKKKDKSSSLIIIVKKKAKTQF